MVSVPPTGTMENVMSAGTNTRYGANLKTKRSASAGIKSSLKNNLMPSANVCKMPKGPQRCGPMRLCMSEMALRSNQIINAVSYTHLRAHETGRNLVCRLLLEKKKK